VNPWPVFEHNQGFIFNEEIISDALTFFLHIFPAILKYLTTPDEVIAER
jgi:hypothetical protein